MRKTINILKLISNIKYYGWQYLDDKVKKIVEGGGHDFFLASTCNIIANIAHKQGI